MPMDARRAVLTDMNVGVVRAATDKCVGAVADSR
jgi:hypothetical protein